MGGEIFNRPNIKLGFVEFQHLLKLVFEIETEKFYVDFGTSLLKKTAFHMCMEVQLTVMLSSVDCTDCQLYLDP